MRTRLSREVQNIGLYYDGTEYEMWFNQVTPFLIRPNKVVRLHAMKVHKERRNSSTRILLQHQVEVSAQPDASAASPHVKKLPVT